jgi:hypothetical protein
MKQKELIKQKVKSVSKFFVITLFVLFVSPKKVISQTMEMLNEEQHLIHISIFKESKEYPILVYYQTIRYESWMSLIWEEEFLSEDGIAFCSFDDPDLKEAFDELKNRVYDLEIKTLNRSRLDLKFKLIRNSRKKQLLFVSEPLIIGKYSFEYLKSKNNKSLRVQKKDQQGNWIYECGVPIQFELH